MILIDRLLAGGIRFVFDKIAQVAEAELNDAGRLREELLEAQMRLELGEIDEEAFRELEADLMARLREIRERELAAASDEPMEVRGVEVSLDDSLEAE